MKKDTIALLLAGGQGSRLGVLTRKIAKPAVLYGGKYRIIDFSLSNCVNSGIDTVGVLTQYLPLKLNSHMGIGKPWDLDRMDGGLTVLPPHLKEETGQWYMGTANAVAQNIDYVDKCDPQNVIILSGDHIYKMDYSKMIDFHIKNNADATISVIQVSKEEASRYGILSAHEDGRIFDFTEKPENPPGNLASMGIYVFTWNILKQYLLRDSEDPDSEHDFGRDIIPAILNDGLSMWAYRFSGYWRDVGTIKSYWESNMDLIKRVPEFNLYDPDWRIYTPNPVKPAHYIAPSGKVRTSMVAEGCIIYGEVYNSVLFPGVYVGEGAVVGNSIVMSNSRIEKECRIDRSILGEKVTVEKGTGIGEGESLPNRLKPEIYHSDITVIGERVQIPAGTVIGKNVVIDAYTCADDFCSNTVKSGESLLKGVECE